MKAVLRNLWFRYWPNHPVSGTYVYINDIAFINTTSIIDLSAGKSADENIVSQDWEQRAAPKLLYKNARDSHICDRIRCVLLAADGWNISMIAKSQLIDDTTIRRHLIDWLSEEKLKPENSGSQSHPGKRRTAELIVYLTDSLLPTTAAIINLIEALWGIRYTVPGLNKCCTSTVSATENPWVFLISLAKKMLDKNRLILRKRQ